MSFIECVNKYEDFNFQQYFDSITSETIERILMKDQISELEYLALLSPTAVPYLEAMAQKAHALTMKHFGQTMLLFTPLYLSDYCTNGCVYCGFNCGQTTHKRRKLTLDEVALEGQAIAETGLRHLIILTGEAPAFADVNYLADSIRILRRQFASIAIEVFSLTCDEYKQLVDAGADSMTMFQETYNKDLYEKIHPFGPKKNYLFRLDAPERACQSGFRCVNLGALLGLSDYHKESFLSGLHTYYLQKKYPQVDVSLSFPRIRPHGGGYEPAIDVTDRDLVQMMLAYRLFMPRAGITLSTREKPEFRDQIIPLGVTKMSAWSITAVGGHVEEAPTEGQFEISDPRDVPQMMAAIAKRGYQPVLKDYEPF